jgi:hypothetical protein
LAAFYYYYYYNIIAIQFVIPVELEYTVNISAKIEESNYYPFGTDPTHQREIKENIVREN